MSHPLTTQESILLQHGESLKALKASSGYSLLLYHLDSLVEEAEHEMQGNLSSDPMVALRLQLRWQQRSVIRIELEQWIESTIEQASALRDEINEEKRREEVIL